MSTINRVAWGVASFAAKLLEVAFALRTFAIVGLYGIATFAGSLVQLIAQSYA